ncbi:MAG: hypothetical protein JRF33_26270 [Deltaproteobacteria bacterium]|nr:hypothetical protein [Deltaproteobacteria bacterium]
MRKACPIALLVLALSIITSLAFAQEPVPVAVMEFASKGGVTQEQMDALGDMLANNIRAAGKYKVIGNSDIRAALNLESQKQLLGCNDDSCVAEIGGALGVRWVVLGNISQFGETYLLNLKLLDVEKVSVAQGISKKIDGGQSALIDALPIAAAELMKAAEQAMGMGESPKDNPKPKDDTPKVTMADVGTTAPARGGFNHNLWGHIGLWSGVGMLAVSGTCFALAKKEANAYFDESEMDAADKSRTFAGVAWGTLGLGVALAATGVTLWLMESDQPGVTATVAPTGDGGAMLGIVGRW